MKTLGKFQWIIVGCIATIVLAVSVVIFLLITSNMGSQDGDARIGQSNTAKSQRAEADLLESSKFQSPAEAVNELINVESTFQRTVSLYTYLTDIDTNDLLELLRRSESLKRNNVRSNIQTIALRKLASIDPTEALRWIANIPRVRRAPMLESVFYEWSLTNLSDAVEGAKTLDGIDRRTALEAILSTRNDLSNSVLLEIAHDLELETIAQHHVSEVQALELLDDPSSAWDFVLNDGLEDANQLELLKLVASAWTEQEGFDVMLHTAALFQNKDERAVLSTVVEGVVATQLEEAFVYLQNIPRADQGELPCALAIVAARINPNLAFTEIAKWSDEPIHTQMQKAAANSWAHSNPRATLDNLELLPQVTRVEAIDIALTQLAYASPEEAIRYIGLVNEFLRSETRILTIIAKQWSNVDPEAALDWVMSYSESNENLRDALVQNVFKNLVAVDTQKALELSREIWSTRLSVEDAAEYDVISELVAMGKIDEAIDLLPEIHEQARYFAIDELGRSLVQAGDPYSAIELGVDVPFLNAPLVGPATYYFGVFHEWADRDPQQLFNSLQAITSIPIRSMAAQILLERQESRPALSDESVKSAEQFLSEHPATSHVYMLELEIRDEKGLIDLDEMVIPKDWFE